MAVVRVFDHTLYIWDGPRAVRKRRYQLLPRREKYFYFQRGDHFWLLHWKPYAGIWLVAERTGGPHGPTHTHSPRPEVTMPVKRRPGQTAENIRQPEAKVTSVMLAKLPALREWMVATMYDDGSVRVPGKLSLEVFGTSWALMLRDPNNGLRLPVRGEDLDKVLLTAEQLLGVEEAPWERDNWLTEQLTKKKKK